MPENSKYKENSLPSGSAMAHDIAILSSSACISKILERCRMSTLFYQTCSFCCRGLLNPSVDKTSVNNMFCTLLR